MLRVADFPWQPQRSLLAALDEAGVRPDLVVGTSVGAVNGAWIAGQGDVEGLLAVWRNLRRGDIFPTRPVDGLLGFLGSGEPTTTPGLGSSTGTAGLP